MGEIDRNPRLARTGYIAFALSGICAISSGIVVSILQEKYGFSFAMTGTLLSLYSIGNMVAAFIAGILPGKIGMRNSIGILISGYCIGYTLMAFLGNIGILMAAFLMVGLAKGGASNTCTVLVGNNVENRTRGMSLMHACYATGAMFCPFLVSALLGINNTVPMLGVAAFGIIIWITFMTGGLPGRPVAKKKGKATDFSFMKDPFFWLVTGLIFCQNGAETAVTGWLVTYYKSTGILSGVLSTYAVTIMWGATLIARLLIAFVFPIRDTFKSLAIMGISCSILYLGLVVAQQPIVASLMLFGFAFAMAGVNPVGVAGVGKMMNETTMGVLLPAAGCGAILMPWLIGIVADYAGLQGAMCVNLIPCVGIFVLSVIIRRRLSLSGVEER